MESAWAVHIPVASGGSAAVESTEYIRATSGGRRRCAWVRVHSCASARCYIVTRSGVVCQSIADGNEGGPGWVPWTFKENNPILTGMPLALWLKFY